MGQGAAMAIEDALSIATLLPLGTKAKDIPAQLELYEKSRQPRIDYVMKYTRLNGADENDPSVQRITGKIALFLSWVEDNMKCSIDRDCCSGGDGQGDGDLLFV
jgi:2-polyprenyl-6-methoxyphenol hydroxylase-like FAD-dependent oxidoreductase